MTELETAINEMFGITPSTGTVKITIERITAIDRITGQECPVELSDTQRQAIARSMQKMAAELSCRVSGVMHQHLWTWNNATIMRIMSLVSDRDENTEFVDNYRQQVALSLMFMLRLDTGIESPGLLDITKDFSKYEIEFFNAIGRLLVHTKDMLASVWGFGYRARYPDPIEWFFDVIEESDLVFGPVYIEGKNARLEEMGSQNRILEKYSRIERDGQSHFAELFRGPATNELIRYSSDKALHNGMFCAKHYFPLVKARMALRTKMKSKKIRSVLNRDGKIVQERQGQRKRKTVFSPEPHAGRAM